MKVRDLKMYIALGMLIAALASFFLILGFVGERTPLMLIPGGLFGFGILFAVV
jgi:hypothetical protein